MNKIKLWVYSINTFVIQIFGKWNIKLFPYETARYTVPTSLCYSELEEEDNGLGPVVHVSCCDCGASHLFWMANNGLYGLPIRPDKYSYKPRLKLDAVHADEEAKRLWNSDRYGVWQYCVQCRRELDEQGRCPICSSPAASTTAVPYKSG